MQLNIPITFSAFMIVLTCCSCAGTKSPDHERLVKCNQLIAAIDRYYKDHADYPPDFESLLPNYISELPDTEIDYFEYSAPVIDGKRTYYYIITARKPHTAVYEFNSLNRQKGWVRFHDDD